MANALNRKCSNFSFRLRTRKFTEIGPQEVILAVNFQNFCEEYLLHLSNSLGRKFLRIFRSIQFTFDFSVLKVTARHFQECFWRSHQISRYNHVMSANGPIYAIDIYRYVFPMHKQNIKESLNKAFPLKIYLFNANDKNKRKRCEICLKLTVKTPVRWLLPANCLSVFDHFVGLTLKGLTLNWFYAFIYCFYYCIGQVSGLLYKDNFTRIARLKFIRN